LFKFKIWREYTCTSVQYKKRANFTFEGPEIMIRYKFNATQLYASGIWVRNYN